jgi:hypothetical protein
VKANWTGASLQWVLLRDVRFHRSAASAEGDWHRRPLDYGLTSQSPLPALSNSPGSALTAVVRSQIGKYRHGGVLPSLAGHQTFLAGKYRHGGKVADLSFLA